MKKNKIEKFKPLKGFGVRADEGKMIEAYFLKIDTGALFRRALDLEIAKCRGVCQLCGTKMVKIKHVSNR